VKLATAVEVQTRLNKLGSIGCSDSGVMESALEGATTLIESIIRTSLKAQDRIDYYDYSIGRYDTFKPFNLWLSQGFVDGIAKVYTSEYPIRSIADGTLVASDQIILDTRTGKLTVLEEPDQGYSTLAVKYSAGFEDGSSDIPDWLREAAISAAVYIVRTQTDTPSKDKADRSKALVGIIYSQINEYVLTPYEGIYPVRRDIL